MAQLRAMVGIVFEGALVYPNCITKYVDVPIVPVAHEIEVLQNTPLPEDEIEEKNVDLAEVAAGVMSRKAYMQKWRGLTDDEVKEELEQIALERQIIDDSFMEYTKTSNVNNEADVAEEEKQENTEVAADVATDGINGFEE